jgi:hypothetical protein
MCFVKISQHYFESHTSLADYSIKESKHDGVTLDIFHQYRKYQNLKEKNVCLTVICTIIEWAVGLNSACNFILTFSTLFKLHALFHVRHTHEMASTMVTRKVMQLMHGKARERTS